ncbi:transmembrane protein, putative (macronuclear) [Tetrahymena thermophila SB210]|uniref:Transmembrane protein, putative n=1 Tax=Tetrahymena thermophila (strain SB210) TaxID=312017 RepID=Q23UD1_TETTS|nr:transmembrane protein, putative [Tetrahymena thermophila SB210]EAS00134.2 transmembrane protein, putative [Tetrahymena thermophila SB210]|eukprot:XP_001020379.2 transmembrane protein, putative [Tetrahymena thermophila SB210]
MWNRNIVLIRKFPEQVHMQLRQFFQQKLQEKYNFADQQIVDLNSSINNQQVLGYEVNKDQVEEISSFIKSQTISLLTSGSLINFDSSIQIGILHNFILAKFKDKSTISKFIEQSQCISYEKINNEEIKLYYDSDLKSLKAIDIIKSNFQDKIIIDDQTFRLIFNNHEISSDLFDPSCDQIQKQQIESHPKSKLIYQSIISRQDTPPRPPSISVLNNEKQISNQICSDNTSNEDQIQQKQQDNKENDQQNEINQVKKQENVNRLNRNNENIEENCQIVQKQNTAQNILLAEIIHSDDGDDNEEDKVHEISDLQNFYSCKELVDQHQNKSDSINDEKKKIRRAQSLYNIEQKPKKILHSEQQEKQKDIKSGIDKLNSDQKYFINILLNCIVILVIYKILIK